MFVACGIWCLAGVSSVSPLLEQTGELDNSPVCSIFNVLVHGEKQFFSKLVFDYIRTDLCILHVLATITKIAEQFSS